jgi:hypothetical protein
MNPTLIRYITLVLLLALVTFFSIYTHIESTENYRRVQDAVFDKILEDEVLRKEQEWAKFEVKRYENVRGRSLYRLSGDETDETEEEKKILPEKETNLRGAISDAEFEP